MSGHPDHPLAPLTAESLSTALRFGGRYAAETEAQAAMRRVRERITAAEILDWMIRPRPLADYHEDMGPVTWWKFPVQESGWIGRPDDSDWPGYHTHFTPHPAIPREP